MAWSSCDLQPVFRVEETDDGEPLACGMRQAAFAQCPQVIDNRYGALAPLDREELRRVAHTHIAKFALTTADERETFMHGTVFLGDSERIML